MASKALLIIRRLAPRGILGLSGLALLLTGTASFAFAGHPFGGTVPEIDPGMAASALAIATGGVMVLTDRLRRKD